MAQRPKQIGIVLSGLVALTVPISAQSSSGASSQALLQQGFQLHQQARFQEALPVLVRAAKLEPNNYFVHLLIGIDLLRTGRAAAAIPHLKLAAKIKPDEEFPEDYLGEAEATLQHPSLAAQAYEQAMARGKDSEQATEAWAGFSLERFRQIGEQLRSSQAGLAVAVRLQDASKTGDFSLTRSSKCAASIPALERELALKAHDLDSEAAYRLSVCYAIEADQAATRLEQITGDPAALHRLKGDMLLRLKGDAAAAEAEYKQSLTAHPGDPALLERLAEAQLGAGELDAARASAEAALAIDPHRRGAERTLAVEAMNNRDYVQALPLLQQLAAESPGDLGIQVELGRAFAQTDHFDEAIRFLAPALRAGYPDERGSIHALEARALRSSGREMEAVQAEAEARRLSDAFQAHGTLGTAPRSSPSKSKQVLNVN